MAAATLVVASLVAVGGPVSAQNEEDLAPLIEAHGEAVPDQYIVVMRDAVEEGDDTISIASAKDQAVDAGAQIIDEYDHVLSGFSAEMDAGAVDAMRRNPDVAFVEEDAVNSVSQQEQVQTDPPSYGVDRVDERPLTLDGRYTYDQTGAGVTVYVLDTGVNPDHTDFGGRVVGGRSFVAGSEPEDWDDCNGHGTHVAGIAAGTTFGIAKNASIHAIRVMGCDGTGPTSDIIAGMDWVAQNASGPSVANMSLGGANSGAKAAAVTRLVDAGVTLIAAAGNGNEDACNHWPGSRPESVTVASTTAVDSRSDFSNYGACVDLFAPGSNIPSASHTDNDGTFVDSGTSAAAPLVAGIAALILEADPAATPAEVGATILAAATPGPVSDPNGSPNLMAYSRPGPTEPPPALPAGFIDDFEGNRGWVTDPDGTDTATIGQWRVGDLQASPVLNGIQTQLGDTPSGIGALATGLPGGTSIGSYDLDGGTSTARSFDIALPAGAETIGLQYYFAHLDNALAEDVFTLSVLSAGTSTVVLSEAGSGVARTAVWQAASFDVTQWAGQAIQLEVSATDAGGASVMEVAVDDITLSSTVVDTTAPTATITSPTDGATIEGTSVTIAGTVADDTGVTSTRLQLEDRTPGNPVRYWTGTDWTETEARVDVDAAGGSVSRTITLGAGTFVAVVHVTDEAGNTGVSSPVTFELIEVDTTAPTVALTSPTQGETIDQLPVSFTGTMSDDSGVTLARLFLEDRTPGQPIRYWDGAAWTETWAWFTIDAAGGGFDESLALDPGSYRAVAFGWDEAGNRGDSGSVYFSVSGADETAPVVAVTTPLDGESMPGPAVPVAGTVSDDTGVTLVRLFLENRTPGQPIRYWDGAAWTETWAWFTAPVSGGPTSGTYNETFDLQPGTYRTVAFAWDEAGNRGDSGNVYFTVTGPDAAPPVVTLEFPIQDQIVGGPTVTLSGSALDDVGVTTSRLFLEDRTPGQPIQYWDGAAWTETWSWFLITPAADGSYSESFDLQAGNYRAVGFAWDAAGNRADTGSVYFEVN